MTHLNRPGVYVANPHLMAPVGSDYDLWQMRRIICVACRISRSKLVEQLSNDVRVNAAGQANAGTILERDARQLESEVETALENELKAKGAVTEVDFILSRTDNILSTRSVSGETRVTPKGYIKTISETVGYTNPALSISQV